MARKAKAAEITTANIPELNITVDDGLRRVPIRNLYGEEIGVFFFRPTDVGIVKRYNEMLGDLDEITRELENISIAPDGTAEDALDTEALEKAETDLYACIDKVFSGNASEAFFRDMHPFSPVGGRFYCEQILEAVGGFISAQFDEETEKLQKRTNKYTEAYKG